MSNPIISYIVFLDGEIVLCDFRIYFGYFIESITGMNAKNYKNMRAKSNNKITSPETIQKGAANSQNTLTKE